MTHYVFVNVKSCDFGQTYRRKSENAKFYSPSRAYEAKYTYLAYLMSLIIFLSLAIGYDVLLGKYKLVLNYDFKLPS